MRHVFLINPHAGKQDQTARIRALADRLAAAHNLDCRCLLTDRPGGAESSPAPWQRPGSRCASMSAEETAPSTKWSTASPGFPTPP